MRLCGQSAGSRARLSEDSHPTEYPRSIEFAHDPNFACAARMVSRQHRPFALVGRSPMAAIRSATITAASTYPGRLRWTKSQQDAGVLHQGTDRTQPPVAHPFDGRRHRLIHDPVLLIQPEPLLAYLIAFLAITRALHHSPEACPVISATIVALEH